MSWEDFIPFNAFSQLSVINLNTNAIIETFFALFLGRRTKYPDYITKYLQL